MSSTQPSAQCKFCHQTLPDLEDAQVLQLHNCGHHLHKSCFLDLNWGRAGEWFCPCSRAHVTGYSSVLTTGKREHFDSGSGRSERAVSWQDREAQDQDSDIIYLSSSLQCTFVLDRVREFLACGPQLRLVSRWFRRALADVPHMPLEVGDYLSPLPLFLWARQELRMPQGKVADKAALGGHLHTLQWLRANGTCKWTVDICHRAAKGGQLEVLKWLRASTPLQANRKSRRVAAQKGQAYQEAIQNPPCPWNGNTCIEAARHGHLEVLQWLRAQDPPCPWGEVERFSGFVTAATAAAKGGHLHVLQWARAQDPPCPWDVKTCSQAATGGHLHVLQWLRAQDPPCDWDIKTCAKAAEGGHFEVLRWLRAQDPPCPWDEWTCSAAARGGHVNVLQWLRAQDPPCPWDEVTASQWGPLL